MRTPVDGPWFGPTELELTAALHRILANCPQGSCAPEDVNRLFGAIAELMCLREDVEQTVTMLRRALQNMGVKP